jgi:hypothetical protein
VAGPTVVVRVLGDLKSLAKSFESAQEKGKNAAKGMHEAFSGMLNTLNKTGVLGPFGEALETVDGALEGVEKKAKNIGPAMMGIGAGVAAVGAMLTALGSKDQAAHQQLQAAVAATGKSYDDYEGKIEAAIKAQEKFGHTANQTQDALRILTTATNDPAKALQYLSTAANLASARHESLSQAATDVARVYGGNNRILKEFGIQVSKAGTSQKGLETATRQAEAADKALASAKRHLVDIEEIDRGKKKLTTAEAIRLRDAQLKVRDASADAIAAHKKLVVAQDAAKNSAKNQVSGLDQLSAKLKGQAAASADTFGGKIAALRAHFDDMAAELGQKYGPAITAAGSVMTGLGGAITTTKGIVDAFRDAQKAQEATTEAVTAAQDAEAVSSWAALGPILLIIAAIAALVAIGYVIYRNWKTIWGAIKAAVEAVWVWIKANWPLLVGILLGPIALAAALIWKYWKYIHQGLLDVWNWIRSTWNTVYGYITAPIRSAWAWIASTIGTVTGWFAGILGWFEGTWSSVFTWITNPIKSAWAWIQGTINTVIGWFDSIYNHFAKGGVWNGIQALITAPFHLAFKAIADLWNSTVGSLSFKIPGWVPGLGNKGFSMPKIPALAQGGLITNDGLVYAHAGEVIAPIEKVPRGPAVVINNAHFSSEVDIDLFMRRAAWTVRAQRV